MNDEWLSNVDSGNVTGLIYIDIKKAFDSVSHSIIIQKRAAYCVAGTTGTGSVLLLLLNRGI